MSVPHVVDRPQDGALVQQHGFAVEGWVYDPNGTVAAVTVSSGSHQLGRSKALYVRPDVNAHLGIAPEIRTGFVVDCVVPSELRANGELRISVEGVDADGIRFLVDQRTLHLSTYDYRTAHHGYQFEEDFATVIPRESVYATGPPAFEASEEVIALLTRYLGPHARVLDVGCGVGGVGRAFARLGRPWTGCEIREDFVQHARAEGLDVQLVTDGRLPYDDASFDAAFAIEVLEHVRDPHPFLAEMARVAPSTAYFTVPDFETISILSLHHAVPWHMLEPDHWNFYARGSLKATLRRHYQDVEVFEFSELPTLRSIDGLPVYNHLFAVARN